MRVRVRVRVRVSVRVRVEDSLDSADLEMVALSFASAMIYGQESDSVA